MAGGFSREYLISYDPPIWFPSPEQMANHFIYMFYLLKCYTQAM